MQIRVNLQFTRGMIYDRFYGDINSASIWKKLGVNWKKSTVINTETITWERSFPWRTKLGRNCYGPDRFYDAHCPEMILALDRTHTDTYIRTQWERQTSIFNNASAYSCRWLIATSAARTAGPTITFRRKTPVRKKLFVFCININMRFRLRN